MMIDLRQFDGRYRCIVQLDGKLFRAVLCSSRLSPSREYIEIGDFYSDQLRKQWFHVDQITVVEVLSKVDLSKPPAPTPWLCRIFGHKMFSTDPVRGIAGPAKCKRCPHERPGIVWPRHPPPPLTPPPGRVICEVCGPVVDGYHKHFMCRLMNGGLRCACGFHDYGRAHRPDADGLRCRRCPVEFWLTIPPPPRHP